MKRTVFAVSIAAAFAAGYAASYSPPSAQAQSAAGQPASQAPAPSTPLTAQIIHLPELAGDALGPAAPLTQFRSKMLAGADGMTLSVQAGNVPKHMHPNTNEIQYILEGTGTVWLDDKEVRVQPGDLIIIPKGTAHAGTKPDSGVFKAIAIKTPPQRPDDTRMLQ